MKTISPFLKLLLIPLIFLSLEKPSEACLSCGCGSSSSSSDLGANGGASSIFAKDKLFLLQLGSSYRDTNGSFNELGTWNKKPTDSNLSSLQNTFSLMYFPIKNLSLGLQIPVLANFMNKASFGSFGSIAPTDLSFTYGISLGDISTQVAYKVFEANDFALIPWIKVDLPTGDSSGKPENISGSGVFKLNGGLLGIKTYNKFEFIFNLGYQQPLGIPVNANSNFYPGNALMAQFNSNYQFNEKIKAGLGINGFVGKLLYSNSSIPTSKIKLTASGQYDFTMYNGVGISTGYDPQFLGANTTTDINLNLVFYQFF